MNSSSYRLGQFCNTEPKGFSLDVILPSKNHLCDSPLKENLTLQTEESTDMDKDHDSTDFTASLIEKSGKKECQKGRKNQFILNGIVLENYMASDNLNECVDAILSK
jgi:hypothetical protein